VVLRCRVILGPFSAGKIASYKVQNQYLKIIMEVSMLIIFTVLEPHILYFHRTSEKHKLTPYLHVYLQERFRTAPPSFPVWQLLFWWLAKWTDSIPRHSGN
jgi:hypothetical protein